MVEKKETKKEEVKIPEKFKKLVEEIEKLSVLDLAELVKILEKKFGVSAAPQVVAAPTAGAAPAVPPVEEKAVFNIATAIKSLLKKIKKGKIISTAIALPAIEEEYQDKKKEIFHRISFLTLHNSLRNREVSH